MIGTHASNLLMTRNLSRELLKVAGWVFPIGPEENPRACGNFILPQPQRHPVAMQSSLDASAPVPNDSP